MTMQSSLQAVLAGVGDCYPVGGVPDSQSGPYLTYVVIVSVPETLKGGAGVIRSLVQVDSYARSYDAAWSLSASAISVIEGAFQCKTVNAGTGIYEQETKLNRVLMEFRIWS